MPAARWTTDWGELRLAAEPAYGSAGITDPGTEIDVIESYAPFSVDEILWIEALGLSSRGKGGPRSPGGSSTPARDRAQPVGGHALRQSDRGYRVGAHLRRGAAAPGRGRRLPGAGRPARGRVCRRRLLSIPDMHGARSRKAGKRPMTTRRSVLARAARGLGAPLRLSGRARHEPLPATLEEGRIEGTRRRRRTWSTSPRAPTASGRSPRLTTGSGRPRGRHRRGDDHQPAVRGLPRAAVCDRVRPSRRRGHRPRQLRRAGDQRRRGGGPAARPRRPGARCVPEPLRSSGRITDFDYELISACTCRPRADDPGLRGDGAGAHGRGGGARVRTDRGGHRPAGHLFHRRARFHFYAARHEQMAVAMADGYARLAGQLGVAVFSRGRGWSTG